MVLQRLDITGPVGPFCLQTVSKKAKALKPSDELIVTCDNFSAATTMIPRIAREQGAAVDSHRISPTVWEITLKKR